MSFENHGGGQEIGTKMQDCKPDYEKQAAGLKKKLDATTQLEENLLAFSETGGAHRFNKISSFAELLGGLILIKTEQARGYAELLKRIETE